MTLTNVDFVGNYSLGSGGGLRGQDMLISGGRFEQNTSGSSGGLAAHNVVLTSTRFISNTADLGVGGASVWSIVATGGSFERNSPGGLLAATTMELSDTQFLRLWPKIT